MRQQIKVQQFGRVVSALGGEGDLGTPFSMTNLRLDGLKYVPRTGFTEIQSIPGASGDAYSLLGLGYVQSSNGTKEFLGIETRIGVTRPYSYNATTLARTEITNGGVGLSLSVGNWIVSSFGANSYLINPSGTKTVYRHVIGTATSFSFLADTAYTPPTIDAALTASSLSYGSRPFLADTFTVTSTNGITSTSGSVASGILSVLGTENDNGAQHQTLIQTVFTATVNWAGRDYIAVEVVGGAIFPRFARTGLKISIRIGGVWTSVETREFLNASTTKMFLVARIKGLTLTAVEGIRFNISGYVQRGSSGTACTVNPIVLGGSYLEASVNTKRLWDGTLEGDGTTYAARFTQAAGGAPQTSIIQATITAPQGYGSLQSEYSNPGVTGPFVGARTNLSVAAANTGTHTHVEFLRVMADGATYKRIGLAANTADTSVSVIDVNEENELAALPTVVPSGATTIQPTPPFNTIGIQGAFAFKQSMIWLVNSGSANIQISRVGNPEELYSPLATYAENDLTQPAQRTLADNQGDIPVWGTQAGPNAFIIGSNAAYALAGDAPVNMTPSQQIPGSRGIAGPYAGTRFRPVSGQYGAAYMDPDGNVWLVSSVPQYVGDTRAEPIELSKPVREKVKHYLFTSQLAEFGSLTMAMAQMEFSEIDGSLWIFLGRRAALYRQDLSGEGWEFYEYRLTSPPGTSETSTCLTPNSVGATASNVARSGSTVDWSYVFSGITSDDLYSTASMPSGAKTALLRASALSPSPLIPASATLTSVTFSVEHSKTGETWVDQDEAFILVSGSRVGVNLAIAGDIPSTDTTVTAVIVPAFPTGVSIANLNAGNIGLEVGYTADPSAVSKYDAANWSISVVPTGATSAQGAGLVSIAPLYTVTATYTGSLPAPKRVVVTLQATVTATGFDSAPSLIDYIGTGTANVPGAGNSGTIEVPTIDFDSSVIATALQRLVITMAGTVGVTTFNVSGSSNVTARNGSGDVSQVFATIGTPAVVTPVNAIIKVDSIKISACYTVTSASPGATSGISWQAVTFSENGRHIAGRSSGQIDVIDRDFRTGNPVVGINRDGGYPIPTWVWESNRITFEGGKGKVTGVQFNTLGSQDTVNVEAKTESIPYTPGLPSGSQDSRWVKFGPSQIGIQHSIKIYGEEAVVGIDGLTVEYQTTSRSKPR